MNTPNNEQFLHYLKTYGFIIPCSEIYGGLSNAWDYGPVGTLIKNNLRDLWWNYFVTQDQQVFGIDSNILLNPAVWKASGHADNFSDWMVDCKQCQSRYRIDHFLSKFTNINPNVSDDATWQNLLKTHANIKCVKCGQQNFSELRKFNLMYMTAKDLHAAHDQSLYLRPETAQGIFINFKNLQRLTRKALPFGIGQVGKSFRNEITIGYGIFRTREFEQLELEYFTHPNDSHDCFEQQLTRVKTFLFDYLKMPSQLIRFHEIAAADLAHYSQRTVDVEFFYPHGWGELWGIAHRGDYDLQLHQNASKQNLTYFDHQTNANYLPHVIEPSVGLNRLMYALLFSAYHEEVVQANTRVVLKLPIYLAPYPVGVFALTKQQNHLKDLIVADLLKHQVDVFDDQSSGSIGKKYRRCDVIGTKYCLTCDFDTLPANQPVDLANLLVTVRDRDSMQQIRINYLAARAIILSQMNPFLVAEQFVWA